MRLCVTVGLSMLAVTPLQAQSASSVSLIQEFEAANLAAIVQQCADAATSPCPVTVTSLGHGPAYVSQGSTVVQQPIAALPEIWSFQGDSLQLPGALPLPAGRNWTLAANRISGMATGPNLLTVMAGGGSLALTVSGSLSLSVQPLLPAVPAPPQPEPEASEPPLIAATVTGAGQSITVNGSLPSGILRLSAAGDVSVPFMTSAKSSRLEISGRTCSFGSGTMAGFVSATCTTLQATQSRFGWLSATIGGAATLFGVTTDLFAHVSAGAVTLRGGSFTFGGTFDVKRRAGVSPQPLPVITIEEVVSFGNVLSLKAIAANASEGRIHVRPNSRLAPAPGFFGALEAHASNRITVEGAIARAQQPPEGQFDLYWSKLLAPTLVFGTQGTMNSDFVNLGFDVLTGQPRITAHGLTVQPYIRDCTLVGDVTASGFCLSAQQLPVTAFANLDIERQLDIHGMRVRLGGTLPFSAFDEDVMVRVFSTHHDLVVKSGARVQLSGTINLVSDQVEIGNDVLFETRSLVDVIAVTPGAGFEFGTNVQLRQWDGQQYLLSATPVQPGQEPEPEDGPQQPNGQRGGMLPTMARPRVAFIPVIIAGVAVVGGATWVGVTVSATASVVVVGSAYLIGNHLAEAITLCIERCPLVSEARPPAAVPPSADAELAPVSEYAENSANFEALLTAAGPRPTQPIKWKPLDDDGDPRPQQPPQIPDAMLEPPPGTDEKGYDRHANDRLEDGLCTPAQRLALQDDINKKCKIDFHSHQGPVGTPVVTCDPAMTLAALELMRAGLEACRQARNNMRDQCFPYHFADEMYRSDVRRWLAKPPLPMRRQGFWNQYRFRVNAHAKERKELLDSITGCNQLIEALKGPIP